MTTRSASTTAGLELVRRASFGMTDIVRRLQLAHGASTMQSHTQDRSFLMRVPQLQRLLSNRTRPVAPLDNVVPVAH